MSVQRRGPKDVEISEFPYAMNASEAFFRHLAMEIGEHHMLNPALDELVRALYRHLGLDPDPEGEFEGFVGSPAEDEPGFGMLEITIEQGETGESQGVYDAQKGTSPTKDPCQAEYRKGQMKQK
jgi:hypothetical protein